MKQIQSVCGPIDADALGHCQIHEHIFTRDTPQASVNPVLRIDNFSASLEELRSYNADGGTSLVDAQPVAAGRDALMLERLSRESGVTIIASTGYHLLGFYSPDCWIHSLNKDELYALFRSELEQGMLPHLPNSALRPAAVTDVRAGMVKAAIPEDGPTGRYKTLLRAAAKAAADSAAPLMLHTEKGAHASQALEICFAAGMRPNKLVVCHLDRQTSDRSVHDEIAAKGVYLDYDTIGRFRYHSDGEEIELLHYMSEAGYSDRLLLSLDTTAARLKAYGGEIGLNYLLRVFMPMLRRHGFQEDMIDRFNRLNCRQLFFSG